MRQQLFLLLLLLFLLLFLPHATFCATAGAGGGRCDRRCGGSFVAPYPFGFSGDCPILLGCNATTSTPHLPRSTAAAPYPVVSFNSTSSTFLVSLALSCNRTVREASASLRGARYDVSSRTTLFLRGGCRAPLPSNCSVVLPITAQCGSGVANWMCVASARPAAGSDEAARGQGQFLNWTAVNESRCEDAVTATVSRGEQLGEGVPSLELAVAELGWWLDGACANATGGGGGGGRCAQNATCHDVVTPGGAPGHRCACLVDGMSGDGFAAGEGCTVSRTRKVGGPIVGGVVGGVAALLLGIGGVAALLLGIFLYIMVYRRRKAKKASLLPSSEDSTQLASMGKVALSSSQADSASGMPGITVDKSVEFSYEELFNATEGFSMSHKIGQGGFGVVYYAELRGKKTAIKKMDMQARREFLAELKVLTHVHHLNLVRLIGYCTKSSLFLVYEYIENGNLSQHLRGTGYQPLSWAARVQIALDSAGCLEYIHEHTVPVYIHRDIKSANILIDKNYRAKVADFGLTKLIEVGNTSLPPTHGIVGTFGYMPPEYVRFGVVSPKVDVFAFGVVLYELISAKEAIVRSTESASDVKGLVYLFGEALSTPDPKESLQRLIDPALGEDYPIDSILKLTMLARACTQEDPKTRPTMRSIIVALRTLSSTSEFWDMNAIQDQENQGLVNLMSGR